MTHTTGTVFFLATKCWSLQVQQNLKMIRDKRQKPERWINREALLGKGLGWRRLSDPTDNCIIYELGFKQTWFSLKVIKTSQGEVHAQRGWQSPKKKKEVIISGLALPDKTHGLLLQAWKLHMIPCKKNKPYMDLTSVKGKLRYK